jgi:hypothetical protein
MDAILELLNDQKGKIAELEARLSKEKDQSAGNLADIIAAAIKGVKASEKEINHKTGNVSLESLDPDDILETPIIYCAPLFGFSMNDYYKHGHPIAAPYGMGSIFFSLGKSFRAAKHGREENIYHICYYKCESKKVQKWLEESPQYRTIFFREEREMDTVEIKRAVRTSQLMSLINTWGYVKVQQSCTQYGVGISDDLSVMRNHLVLAMVKQEDKLAVNNGRIIANETAKETLLLNNKSNESFGAKK